MTSEQGAHTARSVRQAIEDEGIKTVRVTFVDNSGVTRARNVTAAMFVNHGLEEGIQYPSAMLSVDTAANFVVPAGAGFASGYPSWVLKPDPATFVVLPWAPGTAKVVADVHTLDGDVVGIAPRSVLKRVLAGLAAHGYTAHGACEHEFYVFRSVEGGRPQPSWTGINCYAEVKQLQAPAPVHLRALQRQLGPREPYDLAARPARAGQGHAPGESPPRRGQQPVSDDGRDLRRRPRRHP